MVGSQKKYVVAFLLSLSSLNFSSGGKLLVVSMDESHWLSMQPVMKQLKENGHETVVVAPEVSMHIKASDDLYTLKTYPVPFTKEELEEHFGINIKIMFEKVNFLVRVVKTYNRVQKTSALFFSTCTSLLHNQEVMKYLEQNKFDAVFTDPMLPCGQIVAEHLYIPSIFFLRGVPFGLDAEALWCPSFPSYVPRTFTTYTDRMTFGERVKNLLMHMSEFFLRVYSPVFSPYSKLATEFLRRDMTVAELLSHGSIWLMRADFTFEYSKPLMPNMVMIGGINCAGKK